MYFNAIYFLEISVRFRTPYISSTAEYANVVYVYGFCDGEAIHAIAEYQRSFPNRRIPKQRIFSRVCKISRDTSTLTDVRVTAKLAFNEDVIGKENFVQTVEHNPRTITRKTARCLDVP